MTLASSRHAALQTRFCALVGVRYPIVQTGMGWVSGPRLTAATANAGGLGILAAATMNREQLDAAITEVKGRTTAPFGVNLRADAPDAAETVDLIVRHGVRLASFAGAPRQDLIRRLKDAGILTMPTVGARRHAEKMQQWGVDAVIAQGHEGGGHTGPIPTTLLLPDVCRAVDIPVLGAGGFHCGRGLVAAMAYGASGIAMGTRFLLTQESRVPEPVKQQYLTTDARGTVVTTAVDGHPQRVIRTAFIDALERSGSFAALGRALRHASEFRAVTGIGVLDLIREARQMRKTQELTWAQLAMAANAPMLTRASMVEGRSDTGILPTGQVVGVIDELPTVAQLLERIMDEADVTLSRLGGGVEAPQRGAVNV